MVKNIIANFLGTFWSLVSNFLFIPLYIKFLGFESYSIISFSLIVIGLLSILDTGLTSTLSREFARGDTTWGKKIQVFETLERLYLIIILLCGVFFIIVSPLISSKFIESNKYTSQEITIFLRVFSFDMTSSILIRFYFGAYIGLQKQVKVNKLMILWGALRNGLVILLIYYIPDLFSFYLWQAIISCFFFIGLRIALHKELYGKLGFISLNNNKLLDFKLLRPIYKFTVGIMLISLVSSLNTLLDRVFISRMFEVKYLGYYTLAISLSSAVYFLTKPVSVAVLPVFTKLSTTQQSNDLQKLFYGVSFLLAALTFSVATNIFFFSKEILHLWTGDLYLSNNTSDFLKVLILGYSISSLQHLSYDVAIANGNTKINNILGICSLIVVIPGYWFAVKEIGPFGVALTFTIIQTIITYIYIYIINNKYLDKSKNVYNVIMIYILPLTFCFLFSGLVKFLVIYFKVTTNLLIVPICGISIVGCFYSLIHIFGREKELKRIMELLPIPLNFKKS